MCVHREARRASRSRQRQTSLERHVYGGHVDRLVYELLEGTEGQDRLQSSPIPSHRWSYHLENEELSLRSTCDSPWWRARIRDGSTQSSLDTSAHRRKLNSIFGTYVMPSAVRHPISVLYVSTERDSGFATLRRWELSAAQRRKSPSRCPLCVSKPTETKRPGSQVHSGHIEHLEHELRDALRVGR